MIWLREILYVTTGALVVFTVLELSWPGSVLAYLNLNYVLFFWLVIIIILVTKTDKIKP